MLKPEPYFDSKKLIDGSIHAQQEVIRAKYILALARLDRLVSHFEKRSHN